MRRPHRPIAVTLLAALCAGALAACGSSSSSGSGSAAKGPGAGGRRPGITLTASERSCLKRKGVTFTGGPGAGAGGFQGARGARHGAPPQGAKRRFTPGAGGRRRGAVPARFRKQQAALKACGVSLPTGGGGFGGAPGGGGPGGSSAG